MTASRRTRKRTTSDESRSRRPSSKEGQRQQKVDNLFNADSSRWSRVYESNDIFSTIMRQRHELAMEMFDGLNLRPRARVLDVGCGPGYADVAVAQRGHSVEAIDPVQEMIELTRKRSAEAKVARRVRASVGDAHRMTFADGTFDVAIVLGVVPWVTELSTVCRELSRVLVPGGFLIISADNPYRMSDLLDPALNPFLRPLKWLIRGTIVAMGIRGWSPWPRPQLHTQHEFANALKAAGLAPILFKPFGFGPTTFLHRRLFSNRFEVAMNRRFQHLVERNASLLGWCASQYLVLAQRT